MTAGKVTLFAVLVAEAWGLFALVLAMSDANQAALIGSILPTVTAFGAAVAGVLAYLKARDAHRDAAEARAAATLAAATGRVNATRLTEVKADIHEIKVQTDGMKTELVDEVRKASFARGVKSETDKVNP